MRVTQGVRLIFDPCFVLTGLSPLPFSAYLHKYQFYSMRYACMYCVTLARREHEDNI